MKKEVEINELKSSTRFTDRRNFLKVSGIAIAGTGLLLAGCNNDDDNTVQPPVADSKYPGLRNGTFDFGEGDFGILTYAYALEQLEADFYTRVVTNTNFSTTFASGEQDVMVDLYNHEVIHREFFKRLLSTTLPDAGTQLLPDLTFSYGSFNFASRNDILNRAMLLEDTGVAAYNGSGRLISNRDILDVAGKIVSVEGRHASVIRNIISPDSDNFAPTALDPAMTPSAVISAVRSLNVIQTPFTATYLP